MSDSFKTLLIDTNDDGICTISINRPQKLNALNNQVFLDLDGALSLVQVNNVVRVVIITGVGDKSFIAGADIKEFSDFDSQQASELSARGQRVFQKIENLGKPVIAAINGFALGGGCELAMACHLRVASGTAKLGLPEVSLGLIPGYGGTQRLTQLVGRANAMEMILTGKFIGAEEAKSMGLINRIGESAQDEAILLAKSILKQAPLALKNAIFAVQSSIPNDGYRTEAKLFGELFATQDFKEGVTAFFEKRKPMFSGK